MKERQFESLLIFCKYNSGSSPVIGFIMRRTEINELIKFITLLSIGRPGEYLFTLPLFFTKYTEIQLEKLSAVHSHRELLDLLEHTDYQSIIGRFPPNSDGDYDLASIEDALISYNLEKIHEELKKIKHKSDRNNLRELFDTLSDYNNYSRIIRLKKNYHLSNDTIREHLLPYGKLSGKRLDKILSKESYEDIRAELAQTSVGKKAKTIDSNSEMAIQGRFEMCRHQLYFSTNPEIVLLAYYVLSLTELQNVTTIIEGVRYGMNPDQIYELLIL
jgi:V/A-type H+-transporting ATPase subunit C